MTRKFLTFSGFLLTTSAWAHPGHGSPALESRPFIHFMTSGSHIGFVMVLGSAIVAIGSIIWQASRRKSRPDAVPDQQPPNNSPKSSR